MLSVHQGPGLTNAVTGITEAAKSRTPLLVLAADVAASAVRSNFRIDSDSLVRATGAVPARVFSSETAVDDVVRAWRTVRNGRRTVVLNVPLDVQAQTAEPRAVEPPPRPVPIRSGKYATKQLANLLNAAERPVFLAGPRRDPVTARCCAIWLCGVARCWPPRRWRRGSSRVTRSIWGYPAGSPLRSRRS